jgi:hypothetical protein
MQSAVGYSVTKGGVTLTNSTIWPEDASDSIEREGDYTIEIAHVLIPNGEENKPWDIRWNGNYAWLTELGPSEITLVFKATVVEAGKDIVLPTRTVTIKKLWTKSTETL